MHSGYIALLFEHIVLQFLCSRTLISSITTLTNFCFFTFFHRYNQYQTDVYAEGDPWGAIAARGDLSARPYCGGGYDTKITSMTMLKDTQISVVNGPTSQDQVCVCGWRLRCSFCVVLVLQLCIYWRLYLWIYHSSVSAFCLYNEYHRHFILLFNVLGSLPMVQDKLHGRSRGPA